MATGIETAAIVCLVTLTVKAIIFLSKELVARDKSLGKLRADIEWAYKYCLNAEELLAQTRAVFRVDRLIMHLRRSVQKAHQRVWGRLGEAVMRLNPKVLSALLSGGGEISVDKIHRLITKSKIQSMSASIHPAHVELGAALARLSNNPEVGQHLKKRRAATAATPPPPSPQGTSWDRPHFVETAPPPSRPGESASAPCRPAEPASTPSHIAEPAPAPSQPAISIVVSRPSLMHKYPQSATSSHHAPTATAETGGMRKGAQPPPGPPTRRGRSHTRPEQSPAPSKRPDGAHGRPEASPAPKKRPGRSPKRAEPSPAPRRQSSRSRGRVEHSPAPPGRPGPKKNRKRPTPATDAQPDPTRGRPKSAAGPRADGNVRRAQPPATAAAAASSAASPKRRRNARDNAAAPRGRRGGMRGGAQFQPTAALSIALQTGISTTGNYNASTADNANKDGDGNTADDGDNDGTDTTGGPQDYDDPEDYQAQDCEAEDYEYESQACGLEGAEDVEFDGDDGGFDGEFVSDLLESLVDAADCTFGDMLSGGF